jgi:hypothetical protein
MKLKPKVLFIFISLLFFNESNTQTNVNLDYYLPSEINYNSSIPKPSEILFFTPGNQHVSHDRLVQYMYALAESSPRIQIENRGFTYENRPIILLTITSEENHQKIEELKQNRKDFINTDSASKPATTIDNIPVV